MTGERVRVGDVLELRRRPVTVELDAEYDEIGVRSFGRGIFHKEPVSGADLGNKRVFFVESGDLVISNVFAWEGAIGVASEDDAGRIGSHRFMTFVPKDARIDTSWASWFFRSEPGLNLIRTASPGSAGRNRTLAIDRFEAIEIPLPPIEEQRQVAKRLGELRSFLVEVGNLANEALRLDRALLDALIASLVGTPSKPRWPARPLSVVAEINPPPARLDQFEQVTFVPMAAVDATTGTISEPEFRTVGDVGPGHKQFRRGDVIFARITPSMQNGKSAIFDGENEFGYGSTEFHVMRPGPEITAEWLHRVVRTKEFRDMAALRFKGTAGQQRVPADFLRSVEIPVPTLQEQEQAVAAIDHLTEVALRLAKRRRRASKLVSALQPAALNEAFGLS